MMFAGNAASPVPINVEPSPAEELARRISLLSNYSDQFGPHHPYTLAMMADVGRAFHTIGQGNKAYQLLALAAEHLDRHICRFSPIRLRALVSLRDVAKAQGWLDRAASAQREVFDCRVHLHGDEHPEVALARDDLATLLLSTLGDPGTTRM